MKKLFLVILIIAFGSLAFAANWTAESVVPEGYDKGFIADQCGATAKANRMARGDVLFVAGPNQTTLDNAIANYDPVAAAAAADKRLAAVQLKQNDAEIVDVVDDLGDVFETLVELLVSKGVFTEVEAPALPQAAKDKINERKAIRGRL